MMSNLLLDEVEKLNAVSQRIEELSVQNAVAATELLTIAGSVRSTATLLAVLIATKLRP
jgi:hypothetical protein